jgi:hypothetical protein
MGVTKNIACPHVPVGGGSTGRAVLIASLFPASRAPAETKGGRICAQIAPEM